ncbi:MAG TPA: zinc ribbon domain-containing protein [Thermomicrobiales bacterium]|nr:zinc ribbon domain-containing protein [Thermomicrobiales bacterium]
MDTDSVDATPKTCPVCGHENVATARFCVKCGHAFADTTASEEPDIDATQTTSIYVPIGTSAPEPPWSEPEAERTTALPVRDAIWSPSPPAASAHVPQPRKESLRGLVLGIIATMIIVAVLAYYVYAAWLSESLQNNIPDWLP